jgi:hypothetical protein
MITQYVIRVPFPDEDNYVFVLRDHNVWIDEPVPMLFPKREDAVKHAAIWGELAQVEEWHGHTSWANSHKKD